MPFGIPALGNLGRDFKYSQFNHFLRNAATKPAYRLTFGAYAATGFLLTVFFFEWKRIGRKIPVWREYRHQSYPNFGYLGEKKK